MSEYEPGTVADITGLQDDEYRAIRVPGGWSLATGWADMLTDELVTDVRPLVVLDLSDWTPESIQALPEWLRHKCSDAPSETAVRYIANLLEAQTRPPKPAEPQGLGAVVETPGGRYVRSDVETCNPWRGPKGVPFEWDDLDGPLRVLSEGIQP